MMSKNTLGFTLAELLSALAILGVIATFTIPKVLSAQSQSTYNSLAKEAIGTISGAYAAYSLNNTVTSATTSADLTPYMNYVRVDTSTELDHVQNVSGTTSCAVTPLSGCLMLHGGAALRYSSGCFYGTSSLNIINFYFDPDGRVTGDTGTSSTTKGLSISLYANGRITTAGGRTTGSLTGNAVCSGSNAQNPDPAADPSWLSW